MPPKKKTNPDIERLRKILSVLKDEDGRNRKIFDDKAKRLLELVNKLTENNKLATARAEAKADTALKVVSDQHNLSLSELKKQTNQLFVDKRLNEISEGNTSQFQRLQRLLDNKIASIKNGLNGKDADENIMIEKLKKLIPAFPVELTNSITDLKEENVKQQEEIEELKLRPIGRGGGTSAIGVAQAFKYIAHTEALTGAINGSNKTYTVKVDIWWIAGFTLNGENIAELPNFTFANKVITFSSALPAAYSGKDFEIKYIG